MATTIPPDYADLLDNMRVDSHPFHQPGDERVVMVVDVVKTSQMGS